MESLDKQTSDLVKLYDTDRYFSSFFAPPDKKAALLTLYAFNRELDRIPDIVSEPMLGEIRLQWWRDLLEKRSDGVRYGNPLADNLCSLIQEYNLPEIRLYELIDARSFELSADPMPDMQSLRIYIKKTEEALYHLACQVLGTDAIAETEQLARYSGQISGLLSVMTNLSKDLRRGRHYIPIEIMGETAGAHVMAEEVSTLLKPLFAEWAVLIRENLTKIQVLYQTLPPNFGPAFLPITLTEAYLRNIENDKYNPFRDVPQMNPLYRLWKYWKAQALGSF